MNNTDRFGNKYSIYGIEQILGPLNQNTDEGIITYDMVAKKLLDLCQMGYKKCRRQICRNST